MLVKLPVSPGEALDRLSIMSLKLLHAKTGSPQEAALEKEFRGIIQALYRAGIETPLDDEYYAKLRDVNSSLWRVEDSIRDLMKAGKKLRDWPRGLAESVPILNDKRSEIKSQANAHYNSEFEEIKLYKRDQ